jgi:GntR family transcriptional regulator
MYFKKWFICIYSQLSMHSDLVISRADGRPMYVQIMEQIRQRVAVGDWPKGEEIPSIRQLAVSLSVSVITIKRAYLELEREGVIVTQHGKPSRVAADPNLTPRDHAAELAEHLDEAARLADVLGLTPDEFGARARAAAEQTKKGQP